MRNFLRDMRLILIAGALWFVSAFVVSSAFVDFPVPVWCGLANTILGWTLILLVTRSAKGTELFYVGPSNGSWLIIGLIWAIPLGVLGWGVLFWLWRLVRMLF